MAKPVRSSVPRLCRAPWMVNTSNSTIWPASSSRSTAVASSYSAGSRMVPKERSARLVWMWLGTLRLRGRPGVGGGAEGEVGALGLDVAAQLALAVRAGDAAQAGILDPGVGHRDPSHEGLQRLDDGVVHRVAVPRRGGPALRPLVE